MIHRDHSAEAAAPGGERQGRLTLYPGFLNTDCRSGFAICNPSWLRSLRGLRSRRPSVSSR
jgi:hypothetical protein